MESIVLDTSVLIAALRSRRGASFRLIETIGETWTPLISVPLILEYEAVGLREASLLGLPSSTVHAIIDAFCFFGRETRVFFRTRPLLPDPDDEFLLELAIAGRAGCIVTHNIRHFAEARKFGILVVTPGEILRRIERERK
ncbi:MAG TPA: PIN domain-containing protein [Bryobacteraceae bacterium]|nr:PIN domain-containing protein [Bryobacteraceae bacterium]